MSTMREAEAPLLGEQVADMTIQSRDLLAGQVVRMRRRLWRIDHVLNYEFLATPIDGRDVFSRRFLREVEVLAEGSLAIPDPNKASDPAEHDLLLRAFRLSLVHGSAPLAGLQRSRAIPTPYQLVPLLLAVGKDRVRLLIADDVGVGKTIEMGLVTSELIARGKVRRALFVVPANLREQTQEALSHFFHLDATIIAGHLRRGLERQLMPGQSVWEAHDLVVVSVDYAKRHPGEILNPSHPWDLVVFDEAHLCAQPHRPPGSRSAPDMARHDFAKKAAALIPNLMLLTATPHSGHSDSYASLLELLDADMVHWTGQNQQTPIIDREAAKPHVVQRRRSDIERWFSEAGEEFPFPERDQREEVIGISSEERMVLEALRGYTDKLTAASDRVINTWVALHLQKRALSSPEALRCSIKNRIGALQRKLGDEQDSASDAEIAVTDGEGGDHDLSDEELFARVDGYALGGRDEIDELHAIKEFAAKVTVARDSKYRRLVEKVIPLALLAQKAKRVIIFTRYKDTLDYLVKNLAKDAKGTRKPGRLDGIEVFEIHGQLTQPDRRARFAAFEAAQRAVLVATDCISEGMNLQRACAALVHYELPWNPNRLEQRNGRIDRFRQPEKKVTIRTLVYDDPLDVTILEALVKKAQEIRRHYGFSPPFFSSSRDLVDLMRLHGQLPSRQLDLFSTSANADPELLTQEATALSM
ncbi:MAG: DEAD/DEAH box helicase, partial [Gammaproteobacteria bacterium]|nr:DEAD/DEAH box helicase [Gammaproteobacteria bacterium]